MEHDVGYLTSTCKIVKVQIRKDGICSFSDLVKTHILVCKIKY